MNTGCPSRPPRSRSRQRPPSRLRPARQRGLPRAVRRSTAAGPRATGRSGSVPGLVWLRVSLRLSCLRPRPGLVPSVRVCAPSRPTCLASLFTRLRPPRPARLQLPNCIASRGIRARCRPLGEPQVSVSRAGSSQASARGAGIHRGAVAIAPKLADLGGDADRAGGRGSVTPHHVQQVRCPAVEEERRHQQTVQRLSPITTRRAGARPRARDRPRVGNDPPISSAGGTDHGGRPHATITRRRPSVVSPLHSTGRAVCSPSPLHRAAASG